jgi:hypothetical protein
MFIHGYLYSKLSFLNDLSLSIYLCDLCALCGYAALCSLWIKSFKISIQYFKGGKTR